MQSAFHVTTKVLPGNKIEVELPPGSEGQDVTVFVVLPKESPKNQASAQRVNVLELLEEARKHRIGMTAEQIDYYLRQEHS